MIDVVFHDMESPNMLYEDQECEMTIEQRELVKVTQEAQRKQREHIKMFLSEYLAFCTENKYDVLSYIMRNMIFGQKSMRASYLEEVLQGSL